MHVLLEPLAGPGQGEPILVKSGESCRVGRDPEFCDRAFPEDHTLSTVHFVVECDQPMGWIRDLNSLNGTQVNGKRITFCQLKDGDRIAAGALVFQARVVAEEAGPKPAGEEGEAEGGKDRLVRLLRSLEEPLFALVDGAAGPEVLMTLGEAGADGQSLFEGEGGQPLAWVAPYLVSLPKDDPLVETLVKKGWGKAWTVYLTAPADFAGLRRHFREFLMVEDEQGKQFYFRFYDPRVLRQFLPTCTPQEAGAFFGPVRRFLVEDEDPQALLQFTPSARGVEKSRRMLTGEAAG